MERIQTKFDPVTGKGSVANAFISSWRKRMRSLIIVEGPAGSGKSTLSSQLSTELGIPAISKSMSIRNPSAYQAAIDSEMIDHYKFSRALLEQNGVIVDRGYLSQFVYGNLRDQDGNGLTWSNWPSQERWLHWMESDIRHIDEAIHHRLGQLRYDSLSIMLIIYNPPAETIRARRANCDREFSWSPEREGELYAGFGEAAEQSSLTIVSKVAYWPTGDWNKSLIAEAREWLQWNNSQEVYGGKW